MGRLQLGDIKLPPPAQLPRSDSEDQGDESMLIIPDGDSTGVNTKTRKKKAVQSTMNQDNTSSQKKKSSKSTMKPSEKDIPEDSDITSLGEHAYYEVRWSDVLTQHWYRNTYCT